MASNMLDVGRGVWDGLRKAVSRVGAKVMVAPEDEVEDENATLNRRNMARACRTFLQPNFPPEDKEHALEEIGHIAYISGSECNDILSPVIPKMLSVVCSPRTPLHYRLAALRSLTEVCHYNKSSIDRLWKAAMFRLQFPGVISDLETSPLLSRWACKLVSTMVAHSNAYLKTLHDNQKMVSALRVAGQYEDNWRGFECNHANKLLVLCGHITLEEYSDLEAGRTAMLPPSSRRSLDQPAD